VRACRYYPLGNRSNAGVRGEWGEFKNYRDYMDAVNNELLIVPMIETNQALENLDAIASVPGVDVLLVGLCIRWQSSRTAGEGERPGASGAARESS